MVPSLPDLDPLLPLPDNILNLARADPSRSLGFILNDVSPNATPVLADVTWGEALRDVHQRANELVATVGHPARDPGSERFVVGLLLRSGYDYFLTLTATIMLRWTPLVLSPRNSPSGTTHLMRSAQSTLLIVDAHSLSLAENLQEPSFRIVKTADNLPPHTEIGEATDVWPEYPISEPEKLLTEARTGVFVYLHTSGSTGHPKLIPNTHHFIVTQCAATRRQRPESIGTTYYSMMPLSHSAGVLLTYTFAVGLTARVHFLNLSQPPTPEGVLRHLALHKRGLELLLAPSILENMVDGDLREQALRLLKQSTVVFTGGAPLREDVGDLLRHAGVPVQSAMGMTEVGTLTTFTLSEEPEDWQYMALNDQYQYHFRAIGGDENSREMIVLPGENTPSVINHRDPDGFATNDVWEPHPDPKKSHLWRILGRADDITVLSNGEKTNNKQLETLLCSSPMIENAAIFGAGRFLNGAIVSPARLQLPHDNDPASVSAYLDTIYPYVTAHVNRIVPQHSQLIRPLILVATPSKPFALTDKQSLNRKLTLSLYADEIAAAYARVEEGEYGEEVAVVTLPEGGFAMDDAGGIAEYIEAVVGAVLEPRAPLAPDADLFDAGLDSLLAMRVRAALVAALRKSGATSAVPRNIVYAAPTQRGLVEYLQSALRGVDGGRFVSDAEVKASIKDVVEACCTVGSFFVSLLLGKPEVRKIYLLNRRSDTASIEERHRAVFRERGLDYDLLAQAVEEGRVVYLEVSLGQENLGLNETVYGAVSCAELTHIVHCAWLLNFNLILASFKTQIQGVRNLVDLALTSPLPTPAHLIFISSIAVVGRNANASEAPLASPASCLRQGYAHAKYAAEKIIERAVVQRPGFRATIIRIGQIAGAEGTGRVVAHGAHPYPPQVMRGLWARARAASASSDETLCGDQNVRWLPVNVAAEVVYKEIQAATTTSLTQTQPAFYNLENALETPWELVAGTLAKVYALPIVPAEEWLERVRARTDHPANKLLVFFEEYVRGGGLPALPLHRAREAAGDLLDFVVDEDLIGMYASYACGEH
ncbi:hypothetical protein C8R46DRAFT_1284963 [Mycena filopes]|nr:hypothetical protein C8R46DRAFT_1284963 [Mycena filopes]